ncbi:AMP-binding protein [Mycobacterium sp. OTB74]|uniref:class I adenylate-forming enzyme family protein n=1 Tax=Mycobacterium sp. OTB74 TaxID=1853452 RepID=UPI0024762784|nr:AMP-binding protein [Mycobacterium sp. OTB74]MDH6245227.1 long-chain acyl-CoA synthetase [Mycobacterium sp. OTB74]
MADRVVLVCGDRQYSRADLDALVDTMAAELSRRGVVAGNRVALMSSNRPEFVVAVLAVWRLGASVVLLSPAWKQAEVRHALALTSPVAAVGDHEVLAALMPMLHLDEQLSEGHVDPAPSDGEAVLVFSSGTTGMPKAVRHTHRGLAAAIAQWRTVLGLSDSDRMQIMTPPSHILGLLNILTALDAGVWLRLHSRFNIDAMLRHIQDDRITVEMAVAPIALALAAHPDLESYDLSSLRYIMWCATPVTPSVAEEVTRRTGVQWLTASGSTEVVLFSCNEIGGTLDTVGKAVPGVQIRIRALDSDDVLGPDGVGEIQVRSEAVMSGYLPDADTESVFEDSWYRTGDIGYLDADGWLRITDRSKEMIKVRGFQVAPAEIEGVLLGHPAVADCAVFGVPDEVNGEAVIAAVACSGQVDAGELTALVADRLAPYKRLSNVVFVPEIPRLPSGKVLRRVLREQVMSACAKNRGL